MKNLMLAGLLAITTLGTAGVALARPHPHGWHDWRGHGYMWHGRSYQHRRWGWDRHHHRAWRYW